MIQYQIIQLVLLIQREFISYGYRYGLYVLRITWAMGELISQVHL